MHFFWERNEWIFVLFISIYYSFLYKFIEAFFESFIQIAILY